MMPSNRALLACLTSGWLWLASGPRLAEAQILAMPFSGAPEETMPSGPALFPASEPSEIPVISADALQVYPEDGGYPTPLGAAPARGWPSGLGHPLVSWTWQPLPQGLIYRAYLASGRESRLAVQFVHDRDFGWLLDAALGAQVGVLRYGTQDAVWPGGWQLDVEGAEFPRVALEDGRYLVSSDFRGGIPLTFRRGFLEAKFGYYHYCSHLSDQMTLWSPLWPISYSRDALVLGLAVRPVEALRLYTEADWAFHVTGPTRPWQFQFGADVSPPAPSGFRGGPFFAINGQIRQEVNYGGNLAVQTGWQWRGSAGQLLRTGFQYFNGKSNVGQFFAEHEELIGIGVWYDF